MSTTNRTYQTRIQILAHINSKTLQPTQLPQRIKRQEPRRKKDQKNQHTVIPPPPPKRPNRPKSNGHVHHRLQDREHPKPSRLPTLDEEAIFVRGYVPRAEGGQGCGTEGGRVEGVEVYGFLFWVGWGRVSAGCWTSGSGAKEGGGDGV